MVNLDIVEIQKRYQIECKKYEFIEWTFIAIEPLLRGLESRYRIGMRLTNISEKTVLSNGDNYSDVILAWRCKTHLRII